jgi:glycosyltransferase involved in cell wall biosynthesis
MSKISVVMIVKNEEAMLARCLESVKEADEIIVCDTGSTDTTVEIAKKFTDKVYTDFVWNDSFADARNHAKSKATGDYILSIDADEYLHDFNDVRTTVESGAWNYFVTLIGEHTGDEHLFPRLFKNVPEVYWACAIHNYIVAPEKPVMSGVRITYGHSPAHIDDPDRTLRILEREVKNPGVVREWYYYGKELASRKMIRESIDALQIYVGKSTFLPEMADAHLIMSQAYWALGDGDRARTECLQAININANFKEAILWMGAISWPYNAEQWYRMAQAADNRGVLFVRVK